MDENRVIRLEKEIDGIKDELKELKDKLNEIHIYQEKSKVIVDSIKDSIDKISNKVEGFLLEVTDFRSTFIKDEAIMIKLADDIHQIKQELLERKHQAKSLQIKIIGTVVAGIVLAMLGYIVSKAGIL